MQKKNYNQKSKEWEGKKMRINNKNKWMSISVISSKSNNIK